MSGFNHLPELIDALPGVLHAVVAKTAFDGQRNIQRHIRANGQIDTGFMVNSVYTVMDDSSTYQGGAQALPEVPKPNEPLVAYIAVGAPYGAFQNYGTRFLSPRPFFEPGLEDTRPDFEEALNRVEARLKQVMGL